MSLFQAVAILLALTALFSYLNHRFIGLHPSVGVMVLALALSPVLILLGHFGLGIRAFAVGFLAHIDLGEALLHWMLGFLLFAGALMVDVNELSRHRWVIVLLSTAATIGSMFVVGLMMWPALGALGFAIPLSACLVFGALISPTDPVAVVSLMKRAGAPKGIETIISAESLFNDGVGVVLFLTLLQVSRSGGGVTFTSVTLLFLRQSLGGAIIGFAGGALVHQLLKRAFNFQVEVLLTLALVMGVNAIAEAVDVSAPIASVVAGLLIGNAGRAFHVGRGTREDLEKFWELIEEILNAVLFVLIGLEAVVISFTGHHIVAMIVAIPVVLLARWLSVVGTIYFLPMVKPLRSGLIPILTWGGLRGGLAVAMALSLPEGEHQRTLVAITYGVVLFSIIVQGTTIKRVVARCLPAPGVLSSGEARSPGELSPAAEVASPSFPEQVNG